MLGCLVHIQIKLDFIWTSDGTSQLGDNLLMPLMVSWYLIR